jgi:hypothetical protein
MSKFEKYELDFPEKISKQEFIELVSRINQIAKMLGKDILSEGGTIPNKPAGAGRLLGSHNASYKEERALLKSNRSVVLELYKAYYSPNKSDLDVVVKKYHLERYIKYRGVMGGQMMKYKVFHQLTPQECGLKVFPTHTNPEVQRL